MPNTLQLSACPGNIQLEIYELDGTNERAVKLTSDLHEVCPFCCEVYCDHDGIECEAVPEEEYDDDDENIRYHREYNIAIDAMEALIMSCAAQGIAVDSAEFQAAITTTLDKLGNFFD